MEFNKEYYTLADIIRIDTIQSLKKAMKKWGIERTEDKIKEHYSHNAKAFKFMMECYREIIGGKNDIRNCKKNKN